MKKYMLLHMGFEPPTQEIMGKWKTWFESIEQCSVENGGFHGAAKELSKSGTENLPMGTDSITGYSIINAESIEAAEKIAGTNPFIKSIRVYEVM